MKRSGWGKITIPRYQNAHLGSVSKCYFLASSRKVIAIFARVQES